MVTVFLTHALSRCNTLSVVKSILDIRQDDQ